MTKRIPLPRGKFALVDDEDYARLGLHPWSLSSRGPRRYTGGRQVLMHRVITNAPAGMDVSHINGDVLDNRRCNLLVCDRSTSMANKRLARLQASATEPARCASCGQPLHAAPPIDIPDEPPDTPPGGPEPPDIDWAQVTSPSAPSWQPAPGGARARTLANGFTQWINTSVLGGLK